MNNKPKVLVCGDTSTGSTGLGRYKRDLLMGLHQEGYTVAEFAHAGTISEKKKVPWKYYPIAPEPTDSEQQKVYRSHPDNPHGHWRWEKCLLHFKPQIVVTPLDPWQMRCEAYSCLKPFYHLVSSPTVDSEPVAAEYMDIFKQADTLITYSEFGLNTIRNLPVSNCIPMGADDTSFIPVHNKTLHKQSMGFPGNSIIFGFVARNNPRKRFPELLEAFELFLRAKPELAERSFLYFHTTHPDKCWNFGSFLTKSQLYNKVYFSYKCMKTGRVFASLFKDKFAESPYGAAGNLNGRIVNTVDINVTDEELSRVYNLFDLYVHAATNEGFGVPLIEAAACNVPLAYIPYSAMNELGRDMGGIPIDFTLTTNHATLAKVAHVEPKAVCEAMIRYMNNPFIVQTEKIVKQKYSTKLFVSRWIELINSLKVENKWDLPYRKTPEIALGDQNSASEMIALVNKPFAYKWGWRALNEIKGLNLGIHPAVGGWKVTSPQSMVHEKTMEYTNFEKYEKIRAGLDLLVEEDWMKG